MKTQSIRLTIAALAATFAIGGAATASASEKTLGQDNAPQAVAQVSGQQFARGEQNTRVGDYGKVSAMASQIAEVTTEEARGKFGGQ